MPNKRILITGISGFIGSKLKEVLSAKGYEVWGISRRDMKNDSIIQGDLSSIESTTHAFSKIPECSIVIHAAALAHSTTKQPGQDYYSVNTAITNNVIAQLAQKQVKLIFLSSIAVYGLEGRRSIVTPGSEKRPATKYGMSKLKCEDIIRESGLNDITILRPAPVFDDEHTDDVKKRVYFPGQTTLKYKILPSPSYSLCHIDTLTKIILSLVDEKNVSLETLNVVDPVPYDQNELAEKFPGIGIPVISFFILPIWIFLKLFDSGWGYSVSCNLGKLLSHNIYE